MLPKKVLVVDDDPIQLKIAEDKLCDPADVETL